MRVCFVATNTFAVNAFLAPPIEALAAAGWEITIVVNTADGELSEPVRRLAAVVPVPMNRHISPVADLPVVLKLWRLCRRKRFDVIHSITPKGGVLGMTTGLLARVPVRLHTFGGQLWVVRRGPMRRFLRFMEAYVAACATHVLADSRSQAEFLAQHGAVGGNRIEVLGAGSICGVDLCRFRPRPQEREQLRADLGIPQDATVLLFVGRVHPDKGVAELAQAFDAVAARHPSLHLVVVGPEEGGGALVEAGAVRHRGRIHAVGHRPDPQLFMAASDIFCLPSYREGFGLTLIEAAASGLPSVATRIYGITDAVDDGTSGLLVPPRDAGALARAIEELVADSALRVRMGLAARERVQRLFDRRMLLEDWVRLYERQGALARARRTGGGRSVEVPRT